MGRSDGVTSGILPKTVVKSPKLIGLLSRFSPKWLQTWSPEQIVELTFNAESFCGGSQGPMTSYFPSSEKSCLNHDFLELGIIWLEKLVWLIKKVVLEIKSKAS